MITTKVFVVIAMTMLNYKGKNKMTTKVNNTRYPVVSYTQPIDQVETTTLTFKEWVKYAECDIPSIQFLSDIPNLGGYVNKPISLHAGAPLTTRSETVSDIVEFKENLANIKELVFLCSSSWRPAIPYFQEMDDELQLYPVDGHVKFVPHHWLISYAVLCDISDVLNIVD